jgi:hypothetical protein
LSRHSVRATAAQHPSFGNLFYFLIDPTKHPHSSFTSPQSNSNYPQQSASMKMKKTILLLTAAVGLAATPAFAVTVLYFDDFSGASTAALNGTTPDTTIGTNTWSARDITQTSFRADGSITGTGGTTAQQIGSAFLSFTPESNKVYTLSVTLSQPTGTAAGQWASIGFSNGITTAQTHNTTTTGGAPWMLWRNGAAGGNDVEAYPGRAANPSGGAAEVDATVSATLTIELNTLASAWQVRWLVDGTPFYNYTYKTLQTDPGSQQNFDGNPVITQVSIARNASSAPVFDTFTLTEAIPEPSAALLGSLGLLALLRRRR